MQSTERIAKHAVLDDAFVVFGESHLLFFSLNFQNIGFIEIMFMLLIIISVCEFRFLFHVSNSYLYLYL